MALSMLDTLQEQGSPARLERRGWLRSFQIFAALALATAGAVITTSAAGCKSTPGFCVGGYVRTVDKVQTCEGLCEPSKCENPGNVCVDNRCALPCKADADCALGESCLPATTDGTGGASTGTMTTTCQNNGRSAIGLKCPAGSECAVPAPGCTSNSGPTCSCPDGSNCDYTQCGGNTCSPDPVACGSTTPCSIGTCSDQATCKTNNDCAGGAQTCTDGVCSCGATADCASGVCTNGTCQATACTVQGCPMSACQPLVCLSAGAGDVDAYCTLQDCMADANCPGGYACEKVRDAHPICGAAASKLAGLCGISCKSNPACVTAYGAGATCTNIDPSTKEGVCQGACVTPGAGNTYAPGPYCTFRNECRIRKICDPCTADLDCSAVGNQHCVAMGSAKYCAADCTTDNDCFAGYQCTSSACVPRGGSCVGSMTFCSSCNLDTDCAAGMYCSQQGEARVCTVPVATINCTTDAQCPTAPSGLHGKCLDETTEDSPGDGYYHTCYLPYFASIDSFQCWANNSGAACGVNSDCISKKCLGADAMLGTLGTCM